VMDEIKTTLDEKVKEVEDQIKFWKWGGDASLFFGHYNNTREAYILIDGFYPVRQYDEMQNSI
jgi:hypothetical protein